MTELSRVYTSAVNIVRKKVIFVTFRMKALAEISHIPASRASCTLIKVESTSVELVPVKHSTGELSNNWNVLECIYYQEGFKITQLIIRRCLIYSVLQS